jgi:hypothetical protein
MPVIPPFSKTTELYPAFHDLTVIVKGELHEDDLNL